MARYAPVPFLEMDLFFSSNPPHDEAADFISRSLFIPHTSSIFEAVTFSLKILLMLPCVMEPRSEPPAQRSSSAATQRSADVAPTPPPGFNSPFRAAQSQKQLDVKIQSQISIKCLSEGTFLK